MSARFNLVAAGFSLTALSYGLARFAYGLLLPQIRADLALSAADAGRIGGSAFAAYCLGIVATFLAGGSLSPRTMTMIAGCAATGGMALVALSTNGWMLGMAMTLAGVSTGVTSPPLASAVAERFNDTGRPQANGMINTGTAAGIVLSGLAAMTAADAWRDLYGLFAMIGAVVTVWLWFAVPTGSVVERSAAKASDGLQPLNLGLIRLCASAALMGVSSTAIWTFGADILRRELAFTNAQVAWAWIVVGAAGLFGLSTGALVSRYGVTLVRRLAVLGMALGILGLWAAPGFPSLGLIAMGVFGAVYIVATGTLLIRGIACLPDRPDLGMGLPFLSLAIGQTAGAPLFGFILEQAGSGTALLAFTSAACLAIF